MLLRSLIQQFLDHPMDKVSDQLQPHGRPQTRMPQDLLSLLKHAIAKFDESFILIDALDECRRGPHRSQVIDLLSELRELENSRLHILVTSRDEKDIRAGLDPKPFEEISIEHQDADITSYINEQLNTNKTLQKRRLHQDEIKLALTSGAHGM